MAKFVLVHGSWHGAWCWNKLVPLLQTAGHEVIAPDLPGLGEDTTDLAKLTMPDWTHAVMAAIRTSPGPAVLVGHSRGGVVISNVAQAAPELIIRLIFLSGLLLQDGHAALDAASFLTLPDAMPKVQIDVERGLCTLDEQEIVPRLFADCSEEDIAFAKARLRPEPLFGISTPMHLTAERFGKVPRDYIECVRDQSISLAAQRHMQTLWRVEHVRTLDTSHSPFFSAPQSLSDTLEELAG